MSAVAAATTAVLLVVAGRYDYQSDELYFLMLGKHPAWGYVDQPPATPLLARLGTAVFGDNLWGLRVPAALCAGVAVVLVGLIAREIGGGRGAQTLAALGMTGTGPLIATHALVTASLDLVMWLAVILTVMRVLLRGEPKWWLVAGGLVGLAFYNKHLVVLLLLGLAGGLLLLGPQQALRSGWLWAGVVIALVVGSPNLVYQATHGWPQLSMAAALSDSGGSGIRRSFVPIELSVLGAPVAAIWIAGLVKLLRDPPLRPIRAIGVAYLLACVVLLAVAGQPYYALGLLLALWGVGSVPTTNWLAGRVRRRALVAAALAVNFGVSCVLALPVLPLSVLATTSLPKTPALQDGIGWLEYVREVADVYRSLPATEAARAVIITSTFGEAGAIDHFGRRYGLPKVYSGHNALYDLGPPPESATVAVIVGVSSPYPAVGMCVVVARLSNGFGIDTPEEGQPIQICRDRVLPWRDLWPHFRQIAAPSSMRS